MAIKGKTRKRSKARGVPQAPRPTITQRRTPLAMRRDVKRAAVIVLTVASLLGGLRVWQNNSRSDQVRAFNKKLGTAQAALLAHLTPNAPTNVDTLVDAFTKGQVTAKQFDEVSKVWEKDFTATKDAMGKLTPPNEVSKRALRLMIDGIDGYVGVARLYNLAAQIKAVAETTKDAVAKKAIEDKVLVVLQHAKEWRDRSDEVYTAGNEQFADLKDRYGVEKKIVPSPG